MFPRSVIRELKRPEEREPPRFDKEVVIRDDLPPTQVIPHAPLGDPEFMAHR
jgi:hypothetical protein